jgi:hypothetical protein
MPPSQWRNQLEAELQRQALPAAYRQRLSEELLDHQLDLEASPMSMDAVATGSLESRLGDPRTIATQAAKVYRRNFVQRRPLICFVFGPLIGFPVALIGAMALGFPLTEWALGVFGVQMDSILADPAIANRALHAFAWFLRLIPFAAAAFFFVYLARRGKQDYRWSLVAVLMVTLIAASFHAQVADKIGDGQGNFSVGLSFPITTPLAYLQVAAPLAIAVFAYLRRKDHSPAQLAC